MSFDIGESSERKKNSNLKRVKGEKVRKPKKFEKRRALKEAKEIAIAAKKMKKAA